MTLSSMFYTITELSKAKTYPVPTPCSIYNGEDQSGL